MRLFKNILIGLLVLSSIIFLISLLFPSTVTVTREITIKASVSAVHQQMIYPQNWKNWYPKLQENSVNIKQALATIAPGSPALFEWHSVNGKKYELKITQLDSLMFETVFSSNNQTIMQNRFLLSGEQGGKVTRLQWKSLMSLGWMPCQKFSGIFTEKMIAPKMESSLNNLKVYIEGNQDTLRM